MGRQLKKTEEITRSAFSYFVGNELDALGKPEEAEKYWRRSLVLPERDWYYATLSGNALAKRHETSRPDDDPLDKDDLWPERQGERGPE